MAAVMTVWAGGGPDFDSGPYFCQHDEWHGGNVGAGRLDGSELRSFLCLGFQHRLQHELQHLNDGR